MAIALAAGALIVTAAPAMASNGGAVYTLTNAAGANEMAVFDRTAAGSLTPAGTVPTGGLGSGDGLGSQGALVLEGRRLLAVNAGSNTISLLRARPSGLALRDVAPAGGIRPISLTVHGRLVYVLNNGDATTPANIAGFWIWRGRLFPLPGSSRPLSAALPGPAQIEFAPDGRQLVVTEKATNRIVTYRVGFLGYASSPTVQPSAGQTPFGFAFDNRDHLIVSEAFGGAPDASVVSSYGLASDGTVTPIDPNVATTETAACWVVVTENGRYAYATNTGSASVSGYGIDHGGDLALLNADGKTANSGAGPIDAALSRGSHFLYVLAGGAHEIDAYRVNGDGSLTALGATSGLPATSVGLAAS
jgi:DNA-binding beta-propeller fold protein YncE